MGLKADQELIPENYFQTLVVTIMGFRRRNENRHPHIIIYLKNGM